MRHVLAIPGFEGQVIELETSGRKILVNGQVAEKGPKRNQYVLYHANGQPSVATVKSSFDPMPTVEIDGQVYRVAEPLTLVQWILAGVPLVLIGIGGALGGVLGVLSFMASTYVFRSSLSSVLKYVVVLLLAVAAFGVWLGIGFALS